LSVTIKTKPFGEIEVTEERIIDFPDGLFGFDFIKKFVLLESRDEKSPFLWLQAYDEHDLAFVIIRPEDFRGSYKLEISQSDYEAIGEKVKDKLLVYAIVTIPTDPAGMTANLQGPIIINPVKKLGRQAISLSDEYTVRHNILEEMKRAHGSGG
jgi:flagellar assembly factor FliW